MKSTITGQGRLMSKLLKLPDDLKKDVVQAVAISAKELETGIKKKIQSGSRSGKTYKRGKVVHQASAPGEPPKTDTGRLVNSINGRPTDSGLGAEVYSNIAYAKSLEFGTSKMAARPVWFPTLKEQSPKIIKRIGAAVKKAIKENSTR